MPFAPHSNLTLLPSVAFEIVCGLRVIITVPDKDKEHKTFLIIM